MAKSYRDLDIYRLSFDLFIEVHRFRFRMPRHEIFELGSQLRRSADSVNSNIVEGYGRRRYKMDFVKFLTCSHASNDETIIHLEKIRVLYPDLAEAAAEFIQSYDDLGAKIHRFTEYVERNWRT